MNMRTRIAAAAVSTIAAVGVIASTAAVTGNPSADTGWGKARTIATDTSNDTGWG